MQNKILNVVSVLLSIVTEIWVLRLFGINRWDDILGGLVVMIVIPVIALPFSIFQAWLRYIFCDNEEHKRTGATTQSTGKTENRAKSCNYNKTGSNESNSQDGESFAAGKMFLHFVAVLTAKIAKADGHIDSSEISAIELAFRRLGLSEWQREFCIKTFQSSITSKETVSSIAQQLNATFLSNELKAILYEILWDVACADGVLTQSEKNALKVISEILGLHSYERYYRQRVKQADQEQTRQQPRHNGRMSLDDAYEILGCNNTDSDAIVRAAYREVAKRNHPDLLRSKGLPEEMVALATRRMAEINAAWEMVKKCRKL